MSDLIELKCLSCGAALNNNLVCPYCGTRHARKDAPGGMITYTICNPAVRHLIGEARITREQTKHIPDVDLAEIAKGDIARKITEGIADMITYTTRIDHDTECLCIRGEIRVLDPDFRFYT